MRDAVEGVRLLRESVLSPILMPGAMSRLSPEQEIEALQALRLRLHRVEPPRPLRDARAAAAFVRERGIVMETGSSGLPVLAETIVGRQIRGSWMADRDVYRIHRILTGTRRRGVVAAPIVMGKETLFVPALGPAIERVAGDPARRRQARDALPPLSLRLLDDVERNGEVRMDRWPRSPVQARPARLLLVRQLLVWSQSIHTEGGYHTAVVIPWQASAFSRRYTTRARRLDFAEAARRLLLAAIRSALVAPERDVRRWFVFGSGPLDAMLDEGMVRRLRAGRVRWLSPPERA
jgi:hypothetical protein